LALLFHIFSTLKQNQRFSLGSASGLDARSHPAEMDQAKPSGISRS